MPKVVSMADLSRRVAAGAVVRRAPAPPPLTVEEVLSRLPPALTVEQVLAQIKFPEIPTADQIAALVPPLPAPALPDLDGLLEDMTLDERGRLRAKLKSGRVIELRIQSSTTVVQQGGSSSLSIQPVTGDTDVSDADDLIVVDSPTTTTVTLQPTASRTRVLHIKRMGLGDVIVQPQSGETIDGDPYKTINTQFTSLMLAPGYYVL